MKSLYQAKNVSISFDAETVILYCHWTGKQKTEGIKKAGAIILEIVREKKIAKVLNNNIDVIGPWEEAADWAAQEWFPDMIKAGLQHFAWILSVNVFAELSARLAISGVENVVTTFKNYDEAHQWLLAQPLIPGKDAEGTP
jgi:hypothetical protein